MRVDHLAYQRATNIAGLGFLLQAVFAAVLLVLGLALGDTGSVVASIWAMLGLLVWVGLLIVFNQHRLERLESLEADELLAAGGDVALFEGREGVGGVAARRLRMLYRWVLPLLSLGFALALAIGVTNGGLMLLGPQPEPSEMRIFTVSAGLSPLASLDGRG